MTPADPDYGIHQSRTCPEELLIYAILSRAILDLFGSVGLVSRGDEVVKARHDALMFLTQESGGWAQRRADICVAIGFDSDVVRNRVIRVLEGDTSALDTYDGRGALTHVADARKLWEHEKSASQRAREANKLAKERRERKACAHRPKHKIARYADVRAIVLPLLNKPHSTKDLVIATNGDVSDTMIRKVLNNALEKGEIVCNPETHQYQVVPETVVAAEAA